MYFHERKLYVLNNAEENLKLNTYQLKYILGIINYTEENLKRNTFT